MTTKPVEAMSVPAYENKLFFKGIKDAPSSSSMDSRTQEISQAEVMERHNSQNNALSSAESDYKLTGDKILVSDLQCLGESIDDDLAKRVDLDKFQHEENQEYIAELLEEIADKAQKIEEERENAKGWEEKYRKEYECSAMWRDRFLDMERQKNKLEQTVSVEVSNRKYAEKLMDEALIAKYQDEQLSVMLAAKFVDVSKRNSEGN